MNKEKATMSMYCKVKVTEEQFEVVLREMRNRGLTMSSLASSDKRAKQDFAERGYSYVDIGWSGNTIGWASENSDLDVMEFEELMARLDAGIPPLRAFRKIHTYTNKQ